MVFDDQGEDIEIAMGLDQDGIDQKIVRYFFPKALQWLDLVYGIPKEGEPPHWVALGKEWKEMYLLRRKTITSEVLFETSGTAGRSWKHHGLRFGECSILYQAYIVLLPLLCSL